MTERRRDVAIALALFVGYTAVLVVTAKTLGYARDEGFYFYAAEAYRGWFRLLWVDPVAALERANIDRFFSVNHEHPPLMKLAFMLSHELFHSTLRVFSEPGTAYRFPGMLSASLAVAVIFLWGRHSLGRAGALVAALSFAFMPRMFYHAHLACFDMPITSLLVTTAYAYQRSVDTRRVTWVLAAGLLYGVALGTKHNAWLLPFALVAHLALVRRGALFADLRNRRLPVPRALLAMPLLGASVFYVTWPWLWSDTIPRLVEYVQFHRLHEYYNMEFLGATYWKPPMPRGYAWLMTLGTVPLVTLALFGLGVVATIRAAWPHFRAAAKDAPASVETGLSGEAAVGVLWLLCVLVNYAPWWSTSTPIFGGTKHWMTAYPFLCLLAGRGFVTVARALPMRGRLAWSVAGAVLAGPVVMTAASHPFGLSFYTPVVGGAPGAASLGLNRTFWGYTTASAAAFLNSRARPGAAVFLHDTATMSWEMLRRDGRVRPDLRGTLAIRASDLGLYHHEPHMGRVEYQLWVEYGTVTPAFVATYDGVPIVWVYQRPGAR